jgi:signal transduction histidine kinase/CheY-like chemotaxis protein
MLHKNGSRVYVNMSARIINYQGGRATIGTLKDITNEKKMQETILVQRNLFKGVAEASHLLLTEKEFDIAISSTLKSIGESSNVDRVYIFENSIDSITHEPIINQRYEWTSGSVSAEINNPDLQNLPYQPLFAGWYEVLNNEGVITGLVKDFDNALRNFLEEENIKSIIIVPITVRNKFWGFIGFDDCTSERIWKDGEVSILKAIAANLGGVIEKELSKNEIIEAKNTAEEMNRLKSNFLANMSHELRTPLIAILGYAEILQAEVEKLEWTEMVDTISQSGKRLLETLNLILDLSKIESDKVQINYKKINLSTEVVEITNLFNPIAAKKELSLIVDIKEKEIMANIDKRLFHSVLSNLVNNGLKYTNEGIVKVELSKILSNKKSYALIKVSDTGIGISKEDQEIIFDEFRQVSQGYNRQYEGSGLGLTITKKFVEKMGGQISVDSESGIGTTFTIIFPVENEDKLNEEVNLKTNSDKPGIPSSSPNKNKALVIDDDPASRRIMSLFLKNELELDSASTSEEAISFINAHNYSLVFMDISLGKGTNGIDLMKSIRKIDSCSNTPIIAVTAHAMVGDKEKFLSAGFNDYLSKPFSKTDLLHKTFNWLNSYSSKS